ncbi:AraC family transcriptional regulator [Actinomyces viscosus]|uniref:DNA-binding transcriptional regulator AraC n=1 Tax=Actinomyces viscosus TaxID=1656 RepID=A0A448PIW9_ACTVI|nr:AraC family transcriptional regulator [Actinomyces viscosus]TFH52873.1 AraC family transcriptional regulator [Actinomyces viscosus]VEI14852.1 DNA-binding transcriptional regulator AraC [Actinomyces viscosus]
MGATSASSASPSRRAGAGAAAAQRRPTSSLTSATGDDGTGIGDLEVVLPDLGSTVRWFRHGYPTPLARWHHHPEIEFHLIVASHGQMMAGDRTLDFAPGQVTLMGPDLPHNWLSDLGPGECLEERDVLCQVLPQRVAAAARALPELSGFETLVERSRRGIVLSGTSAAAAAELLTVMGRRQGMGRLGTLLALAEVFLSAPGDEWWHIAAPGYVPSLDDVTTGRINEVLTYIEDNLEGTLSMEAAASRLAMSPSAFSRFFHATAGITFSALVRRRRIARTCHLLRRTDLPVARVADLSGYTNLANFNRRFRDETGTTPSSYRKASQAALGGRSISD